MSALPDGVSACDHNLQKPSNRHKKCRPSTPELLRAAQPTPAPSRASTIYLDPDTHLEVPVEQGPPPHKSCCNRRHELQPTHANSQEYFDAQLQTHQRTGRVKVNRSPSSTEDSYETGISTLPTSAAPSFATCTQSSQEGYFTGPEDVITSVEKEAPKAVRFEDTVAGCGYPDIEDPVDPARILAPKDLRNQRILFFATVLTLNLGCAAIALFANEGMFVFVFILFIKSKDFLSVLISALGILFRKIYRCFKPLAPVPQQWILTLIPAYSESEEQIVKTIYSLRDNDVEPHRQVMVVLLDGKHRDVKSHMTRVIREFERPYISLKHKRGVLQIKAGFMQDVPVIVIEKVKNSGKKDSLVLCHDLFNHPRPNLPLYTRLLREELWRDVLPILTEGENFTNFDMVSSQLGIADATET